MGNAFGDVVYAEKKLLLLFEEADMGNAFGGEVVYAEKKLLPD
jgi:hypothetical protein